MQKSYYLRQLLVVAGQLMLILYLCVMAARGYEMKVSHYIHFGFVFLLFADAAYISYKNVQNNRILSHFTFWLLLCGWQFLLSLFESHAPSHAISIAMLPLALYQAIYFIQLFVFQASAYQYQKGLLVLSKLSCILSTVCCFISPTAFALAYLGQAVFCFLAILFAIIVHRRRVCFLLKSQKRELLLSCCFVVLPLACYVTAFHGKTSYLDNLGSYFFVLLAFVSIHSIVFRLKPWQEKFYGLSKRNMALLALVGVAAMGLAIWLLQIPYPLLLVQGQIVVLLAIVYSLLLYRQICTQPQGLEQLTNREHFYAYSLTQIKREEALKKDFSNYLHDDILQDLFSIKNLVRKANQPQVQQLLLTTLGELGDSIRAQMQAYHPVLLKSMTLKESIQTLLDSLTEQHPMAVCLDCENSIFLAEPYGVIIYRMIKELITNAIKHSGASMVRVLLTLKQDTISLTVTDNGKGFVEGAKHHAGHSGLSSIGEQVSLLDGVMSTDTAPGAGTQVVITMPMRGDDSYQAIARG